MKTRQVTEFGMFLALGLVLSYLETIFPIFIAVPGVKLGLANIVTMLLLYRKTIKGTILFMTARVILAGLLFSGISGILYSFAGGILCILIMSVLKKFPHFSILGVSMAGAVFHNLGQIIVALFVMENVHIFYYLPVLSVSGVISGLAVGYVTYFLLKKLKNR